jgi:hypothetical protein
MAERTDADEDRRRSPRFSCAGHAKIDCLPSKGIFVPGKMLDLSLDGCCVDTTLPMDCGARAEIVVHVNAASFRALGEVREIRGQSRAGMKFVRLSAGGKDVLAGLIAELARLQAAMNKLRFARREMDAETFRKQLKAGELLEALLRARYRFHESSGPGHDEEEKPRVIPVNLFG